jgi:hypothetical protein
MKNQSIADIKEKTVVLLMLILIGLLFVALIIYGIKGTYSRYAQDDYCYGYRVNKFGFFEMQISSYFNKTEFNSNRYSATISHSIVELLGGPIAFPFVPPILMIGWILSLGYLVYVVFIDKVSLKTMLFISIASLSVIYFTFYLSDNLYQILYWLAGQQSYLMPTIICTFIFARILHFSRSKAIKFRNYLEIALLCLWAGGFSETTTLWFFSALSLFFIIILIYQEKFSNFKSAKRITLISLTATLVALLILILCPVNQTNLSHFNRPDLSVFLSKVLIHGIKFPIISVKSAPLPYIVLAALGFWLSFCINTQSSRKLQYFPLLLGGTLIAYILFVAVMVPTMFAMSAYPNDRALLPAIFSLVCHIFVMGYLVGKWIQKAFANLMNIKLRLGIVIIIGIFSGLYLLHTIPNVYDKFDLYQARAEAWDQRQVMIFQQKNKGINMIKIPEFDSVYGIAELNANPKNWVNQCAALYYGVSQIQAIENYKGFSTVPIGK